MFSSLSLDLAHAVAPVILLESHCASARDTVQCLCVVKSNPEPSVAFELPSRNVTVNETEREFVYSERSGLLLTSILTLRGQSQAPPRVICTSRNLYGTKSLELPFQGARESHGLGMGATGTEGTPLESRLPCSRLTDHQPPSMGQAMQVDQVVKRPFWSVRRGCPEFAYAALAPPQALWASQSMRGCTSYAGTITPAPAHLLESRCPHSHQQP